LRGGGGNFGVATSFEYQLHPVGPVLAGIVAYRIQKAKTVLGLFREVTTTAPEELAFDIVLITLPDGTPIVGMNICYNGPIAEGEKVVRPLRSAGSPVLDQVGSIPYTAAQQLIDGFYPTGLQSYWKSSFLHKITDEAIDTMVAYCNKRPTPICHGIIEHQLGGAVRRVAREATAFAHRDVEYSFMALGVSSERAEAEQCVRWARDFGEPCNPTHPVPCMLTTWGRKPTRAANASRLPTVPRSMRGLWH
jgi:hypothetical protein